MQPLWRTVWRFLKKLGIKILYDPTIPLLGIFPEETITEKDTWTPVFIAALFTIARTWKQPRCPLTDEWIKQLWDVYTMKYHSVMKRNECEWVLMMWMNLEPIIQWSMLENNKYHILMHMYGTPCPIFFCSCSLEGPWRKVIGTTHWGLKSTSLEGSLVAGTSGESLNKNSS